MKSRTFQQEIPFTLTALAGRAWTGLKWVKGIIHASPRAVRARTDAPRLMVVTAGRSEVSWRHRRKSVQRTVAAGAVTFLDADVELDQVRSAGDYESFGIELEPAAIDRWTRQDGGGALRLRQLPPHVLDHDPLLLRLADAMERESRSGCASGSLYAESLCIALVGHVWERHARVGAPARGGLSPVRLAQVKDYLWAHLGDDIPLGALASLAGLSPRHFCSSFSRAAGVSPHRYLMGARIARSKELLRSGHASITEVAMATGFASPSHFASAFKRATALTPSEYQKLP